MYMIWHIVGLWHIFGVNNIWKLVFNLEDQRLQTVSSSSRVYSHVSIHFSALIDTCLLPWYIELLFFFLIALIDSCSSSSDVLKVSVLPSLQCLLVSNNKLDQMSLSGSVCGWDFAR